MSTLLREKIWLRLDRLLPWSGAALIALLAAGCGKKESGGGGPPPMAVEVILEKPSLMTVEDLISAVGTVEPNERVHIQPETAGLITSIFFTEGQRVKKGDKLVELNPRKESANVAQAEAEEKLAEANVKRARTLLGTKAISQQEVEQLESQVAVKAAVRQVEQQRLAERVLYAPFDGVVGPRLVSPGQYVTMGTSLVTLVDDSKVKVSLRIPERQLTQVKLGQEGRLRVSAHADKSFRGKIDLINPEIDQATRTAELRLLVENPDGQLKPGMFAHLELIVGVREAALVIPESALVPALDQFTVFVAEKGIAQTRPVKLGRRLPGKVEVVEGLTTEHEVVVNGTQKLVEGMMIKAAAAPVPPVASTNQPQ